MLECLCFHALTNISYIFARFALLYGGIFSTSATADTIKNLTTITVTSSSIRKSFAQIPKLLGILIEEIDANDPSKGVIDF